MNDINTTSSSSRLPTIILVVLALVGVVLGGAGLYSSLSNRDDVAAVKAKMETDLGGGAAQLDSDLSMTKTKIQTAFSQLGSDVASLREQLSNSMARATSPKAAAGVKQGAGEQPLDPNGTYHKIRPGDLLGRVAKQYGTTVAAIEALNPGIDSKHMKLGQKVRVK